jgi:hypothetical protein
MLDTMFDGEIGFYDVEIDTEDARLFHALTSNSLDNSRWGHHGEIGFFDVEIDIEDARLFHALTSNSLDNSRWGHLIEGVRLCLQSCARWKLVKIPKFCNSATKSLAKMVNPFSVLMFGWKITYCFYGM